MAEAVESADCVISTPLLFLQAQVGERLGLDVSAHRALLDHPDAISTVFLDNLKTATPWVLKAVGVEYLLDQVEQGNRANVLHIATHFSNLIKVSENVVVRRMAGASLLSIAPVLTPDRRNEIAVELSKALETGQSEISKYIPEYLGRFALWLTPGSWTRCWTRCTFCSPPPTATWWLPHFPLWGPCWSIMPSTAAASTRMRPLSLCPPRADGGDCSSRGSPPTGSPCGRRPSHSGGEGLFASSALAYEDKAELFHPAGQKGSLFSSTSSRKRS